MLCVPQEKVTNAPEMREEPFVRNPPDNNTRHITDFDQNILEDNTTRAEDRINPCQAGTDPGAEGLGQLSSFSAHTPHPSSTPSAAVSSMVSSPERDVLDGIEKKDSVTAARATEFSDISDCQFEQMPDGIQNAQHQNPGWQPADAVDDLISTPIQHNMDYMTTFPAGFLGQTGFNSLESLGSQPTNAVDDLISTPIQHNMDYMTTFPARFLDQTGFNSLESLGSQPTNAVDDLISTPIQHNMDYMTTFPAGFLDQTGFNSMESSDLNFGGFVNLDTPMGMDLFPRGIPQT
jgi:hypothetical protein